MVKIQRRNKTKWFKPGKKLNWKKDLPQSVRISRALKSRNGNVLKTAKALQALANVTEDTATKQKAMWDAKKLFEMYKKGEKKRYRI